MRGGCTGFTHHLDIDNTIDPDKDIELESQGVKVVIDKKSSLYMGGSVIDWDQAKQGFRIENPITTSRK